MSLREPTLLFEGMQMRCSEGGRAFPILLLHGSGPGASTASTWHLVLPQLAKRKR
jgi:2-hydroxymuconate-semialdehyde hydrolase